MMILSQYHIFELDTINIYSAYPSGLSRIQSLKTICQDIIFPFFAFFRGCKLCCGSGSGFDLALLDSDPYPYWECGSGSRRKEIDQNIQINLISSLSKRLLYLSRCILWPITYFTNCKVYFSCQYSTFSDGKVWPRSGSALVWLPGSRSGAALR